MKKILLALLTLALLPVLSAAPAKSLPKVPVFKEKFSFKVAPGVIENSHKVTFPSVVPRKGYNIVLRFDCRIATKTVGGWNHYTGIDVNGTPLGKFTAEGTPRLLLRGSLMETTIEGEKDWWNIAGGKSNLMSFFSPESAVELDSRILTSRDQKYVFHIDVTDCINYSVIGADDRIEGGEPNEIVFYDRLSSKIANVPMAVKDVQLFYVKKADILKASAIKLTEFKPVAKVASLKCNGAELAVMPNGGMSVKRNGEVTFIESNFSYEAKPTYQNNRFNVAGKKEGAAAWKVSVKQVSDSVITVKGTYKDYTITRTLTLNNHRIDVKDEYKNTSGRDLGMLWSHIVGNNALLNPTSRMAGQTMPQVVNFFGSSNPTLYNAGKNSAVGLLAEDTVSRAQLQFRTIGNIQRMSSIGMGIPAGKTHTMEWAIYPLDKADYYALINQVRRDWKVNYTIDGPYAGHAGYLVKKAMVKPVQPWHDYASGAGLTDEQFAAKVLPQMEEARKINPDIKLLGMIETNLVAFDTRKVPWSNKLKIRTGARTQPWVAYGIFMDKETTKLFDAYSPYRDSVIRDASGNAMYENYYTSHPFVNLMVQPEVGNERYKGFMRQIDFMMGKLGFNGIYIDQFQPYIIGGFSENRWDGYTVELAADGSIKRKRYSYAITGATARANIIKTVRDRGGIVVTNGQPMSREEQNTGVFAFQEMENDDVNPVKFMDVKPPECRWQVVSHLGSPIALGLRPRRYIGKGATAEMMAQVQTKGIITALRNSLVFYFYTVDVTDSGPKKGSLAICENMFPFTPEELHEGWIKGKERTITAISGKFPVNGKEKPQVLYFDKKGFEQANNFAITGEPGNWIVDVKLNDWNEVAIMIAR